ncbi:hypothetical protein ACLOJK_033897 [Asimina triloba]
MERELEIDGGGAESNFPFTFSELATASSIVLALGVGLLGLYLTMPASDYTFLVLPRTLQDLQILRDNLESYTSDYPVQVLVGYFVVYIFMQTFMIPGTVFMSLLAGALYGVFKGVVLVVFAATAGASSCFFLSKQIGKPLVFSLWPDKLSFFQAQAVVIGIRVGSPSRCGSGTNQAKAGGPIISCSVDVVGAGKGPGELPAGGAGINCPTSKKGESSCLPGHFNVEFGETMLRRLLREQDGVQPQEDKTVRCFMRILQSTNVAKRRERLLNYMLFLRVTPTLPNTFINVASPIVDVPYHIFFLATFIGLIPAAYVTVRAGIAIGELRSVGELYDFQSLATLFLIGIATVTPTLISKGSSEVE